MKFLTYTRYRELEHSRTCIDKGFFFYLLEYLQSILAENFQ